ncbi:hypothetical protein Q6A88_08855 [Aliarcobacter skirrowii]|uniref:hypothetical protein n=1 Tax=Aliarcobacter skirrowii TaxID=28200 RepID=UPI0029B91467|nr:hypothetical protein [Aliarcobacter skirrowii]MDX4071805.1 hypothetical protein [Aliarcobacter skirrowii]
MKKNLILASSPLQVINALEAIYYFKLKNIVFVLKFNKMINNINQIEEQIKSLDDKIEIIRIHPVGGSKFFKYVNNIKNLNKYEYDKIILGEFGTFSRVLIANLNKNKVFLVDDGTATIVDFEKTIKPNKINKFNFRELRFLFYGLKINVKDKLNFFTYYDLEKLPDVEVIKNNLEYMRKDFVLNNIDYGSTIFILGQVEEIFEDKNEAKMFYSKVLNNFQDKDIYYIPHRAESKKDIDDIIKFVGNNIKILEINMPVERYFLDNGIYPKHVISYISTALTTTKILFPECTTNYIRIQKPNFNLSSMHYLDILYDYFEKDNILEIKL